MAGEDTPLLGGFYAGRQVGLETSKLWEYRRVPFFPQNHYRESQNVVSAKFFLSCTAAYFGDVSQITHSDTLSLQFLESTVSTKKSLSLSSESSVTLLRCLGHTKSLSPQGKTPSLSHLSNFSTKHS